VASSGANIAVSSVADDATVTTTTFDTTTETVSAEFSVETVDISVVSTTAVLTTPVGAAAMTTLIAIPVEAATAMTPGESPKSVKSVSSISSPSEEIAPDVSERVDEVNFPTAIPLSRKPETDLLSLSAAVNVDAKLAAVGVKEDIVTDSTIDKIVKMPTQSNNSRLSSMKLPADVNQNGTSLLTIADREGIMDTESKVVKPASFSNEQSKMEYEVNICCST